MFHAHPTDFAAANGFQATPDQWLPRLIVKSVFQDGRGEPFPESHVQYRVDPMTMTITTDSVQSTHRAIGDRTVFAMRLTILTAVMATGRLMDDRRRRLNPPVPRLERSLILP